MESISDQLDALARRLHTISGVCEIHGDRSVMTPNAHATFSCPDCAVENAAAQSRERHLNERRDVLRRGCQVPQKYVGESFKPHNREHKLARAMARSFLNWVFERKGWAALVLTGETGTGKTLMACELLQTAIEKACLSSRYVTANMMIAEIQASYTTEGKTEQGEIQRFINYDLLVVDEIDQTRDNANTAMLISEVVNGRYNDGRPMIVISNKDGAKFKECVGDRVASRMEENGFFYNFDWPDFRRNPV